MDALPWRCDAAGSRAGGSAGVAAAQVHSQFLLAAAPPAGPQAVDLAAQLLLDANIDPNHLVLARGRVEAEPGAPRPAAVNRPSGGGR